MGWRLGLSFTRIAQTSMQGRDVMAGLLTATMSCDWLVTLTTVMATGGMSTSFMYVK